MKINQTQARIVTLLKTLDIKERNLYSIANKVNRSFSVTYQNIKLLEQAKIITKYALESKKPYYVVTDPDVLDEAIAMTKEAITNEDVVGCTTKN